MSRCVPQEVSEMLLLIDAGNTRVKWALLPRTDLCHSVPLGQWVASGSVERTQVQQLANAWRNANITRVLLSNVAGQTVQEDLEQTMSRTFGLKPVPLEWFCAEAQLGGIHNRYRNPAQLGCDRFASVIGAHALFPAQPLIVATCGTATTIDAVTGDGAFLGGMILPGLGLMMSSLAKNTAQLPQVAEHLTVSEPFADYTDAAIVSGCLAAQAGAIERAVAAHAKTHGAVQCILAGGAAHLIAPHLSVPYKKADNLVLIGLQIVAGASC
jgi:type III pantothenate kinase